MCGIPRLVDERNLPILGTPYRAADIADRTGGCHSNVDMLGGDMSKPGAQVYYGSVFKLFAPSGFNFSKVDDTRDGAAAGPARPCIPLRRSDQRSVAFSVPRSRAGSEAPRAFSTAA